MAVPLEDSFKKAVTELLFLQLISERPYYIGELAQVIQKRSRSALSIVFPYAAIYRLIERGHIEEIKKQNAPDGRRRQYYQITESGRTYLEELLCVYRKLTDGVAAVILKGGTEDDASSGKQL